MGGAYCTGVACEHRQGGRVAGWQCCLAVQNSPPLCCPGPRDGRGSACDGSSDVSQRGGVPHHHRQLLRGRRRSQRAGPAVQLRHDVGGCLSSRQSQCLAHLSWALLREVRPHNFLTYPWPPCAWSARWQLELPSRDPSHVLVIGCGDGAWRPARKSRCWGCVLAQGGCQIPVLLAGGEMGRG